MSPISDSDFRKLDRAEEVDRMITDILEEVDRIIIGVPDELEYPEEIDMPPPWDDGFRTANDHDDQ